MNKDKIKEYQKEYRERNKDKINEYRKKYYEENKDKINGKTDTFKIYKLIYNEEVIYVGLTKLSLSRRKSSSNYSVPKEIYKLSKIELIEETNDKGRERFWVEHYLKLGATLMNKRNGDFSNKEQSYLNNLYMHRLRYKLKSNFKPKTEEEKKETRRKYYELNKEILKEKRRKKNLEKKLKNQKEQ